MGSWGPSPSPPPSHHPSLGLSASWALLPWQLEPVCGLRNSWSLPSLSLLGAIEGIQFCEIPDGPTFVSSVFCGEVTSWLVDCVTGQRSQPR